MERATLRAPLIHPPRVARGEERYTTRVYTKCIHCTPLFPDPLPVEHYYTHFLSLVKDLLDCNIEQTAFEDKLREMFGVNSYIAFTLDKLITHIVRQVPLAFLFLSCPSLPNLLLF